MTVAVVLGGPEQTFRLDSRVAARLADLGVTDASLLHGHDGSALVLSGWDFEAERHEPEIAELVAPGGSVTVLNAVAEFVLRPGAAGPETVPSSPSPVDRPDWPVSARRT